MKGFRSRGAHIGIVAGPHFHPQRVVAGNVEFDTFVACDGAGCVVGDTKLLSADDLGKKRTLSTRIQSEPRCVVGAQTESASSGRSHVRIARGTRFKVQVRAASAHHNAGGAVGSPCRRAAYVQSGDWSVGPYSHLRVAGVKRQVRGRGQRTGAVEVRHLVGGAGRTTATTAAGDPVQTGTLCRIGRQKLTIGAGRHLGELGAVVNQDVTLGHGEPRDGI